MKESTLAGLFVLVAAGASSGMTFAEDLRHGESVAAAGETIEAPNMP